MTSFKRYNAFTFKRPRNKAGTYQLINLILRCESTSGMIRFFEKNYEIWKNLPILDSWSLCLVDCVTGESPGLINPITGVVKNLDISNREIFYKFYVGRFPDSKYLNSETKFEKKIIVENFDFELKLFSTEGLRIKWQYCWWHCDIRDSILVTICRRWWLNLDFGALCKKIVTKNLHQHFIPR